MQYSITFLFTESEPPAVNGFGCLPSGPDTQVSENDVSCLVLFVTHVWVYFRLDQTLCVKLCRFIQGRGKVRSYGGLILVLYFRIKEVMV